MKKTVIILILILVASYGILSIVSSNDDYAAEKLFFKATKINRKIIANPDVAPPVMLASVENTLKKILDKYPKSKIVKAAHLGLAEFYSVNKKYEQARSTCDEIINAYSENKLLLSKAQFLKASAYEKGNQWEKALEEYKVLRDKYPQTPLGVGVPLYIGNYYTGKGENIRADKAYNEAVQFYRKLESENKGEALGYVAANLSLQANVRLKRYEQAGQTVEAIINDYPNLRVLIEQIPNIELIFIKQLDKPEKARELYLKIKEKVEDSRIIEFIDGKIKALEAQK